MNNKIIMTLAFILSTLFINAQTSIIKPDYLKFEIPDSMKTKVLVALDSLFTGIDHKQIDSKLIDNSDFELNNYLLQSLNGNENKDSIKSFYQRQLINLYPVSQFEYAISIAYIGGNQQKPILGSIYNLMARYVDNRFVFSSTLKYLTKTWKSKVVGTMTYIYRDTLNLKRATECDIKNKTIATKLGLAPRPYFMYMCYNYQDFLHLVGCEYDINDNGKSNAGFIIDPNYLFSVMNNEDFSHDLFHMYAWEIRKPKGRNFTAEEGISYSWGNAYHADYDNNIATQKELVIGLQKYLKENPNCDLLNLFDKNIRIYQYRSNKLSVKSVISGIICDEIERVKGIDGIKQLIGCDKGDDNFFKCTNDLLKINRSNFNIEVKKMIDKTKN